MGPLAFLPPISYVNVKIPSFSIVFIKLCCSNPRLIILTRICSNHHIVALSHSNHHHQVTFDAPPNIALAINIVLQFMAQINTISKEYNSRKRKQRTSQPLHWDSIDFRREERDTWSHGSKLPSQREVATKSRHKIKTAFLKEKFWLLFANENG